MDDLLDDQCYEPLLHVCASGIVAYAAASPSCCEYSRLKLKPGGPPALRTPEFLQGKPNLSSAQLLRVQESNVMLERCVSCLRLVISSGGHSHLEQPSTAMSWQEPVVQQYIQQESCNCIAIAACGYGKDWHKTWMLASTFLALEQMACECPHPKGSHQQIAGTRSTDGLFFAETLLNIQFRWQTNLRHSSFPCLQPQGFLRIYLRCHNISPFNHWWMHHFLDKREGGTASQADWSAPHPYAECFQVLRNFFFRQIMNDRLDQVIMRAFSERWDQPPVSMEQIAPFWKNFSGHKGWFPTGQFQKIRTLHCSFYSSSASVWTIQMKRYFNTSLKVFHWVSMRRYHLLDVFLCRLFLLTSIHPFWWYIIQTGVRLKTTQKLWQHWFRKRWKQAG